MAPRSDNKNAVQQTDADPEPGKGDYQKGLWREYLRPLEPGAEKPPSKKGPRYEKSGVLLVDKPAGISSMDLLRVIKINANIKKAGHGGTLDPFATGLIPVLIGKATAISKRFLESGKTYEGTFQLGVAYDTQDITGVPVAPPVEIPDEVSVELLHELAQTFTGNIRQTPPLYSAIKKKGKPLYRYAREGSEVEIESREVRVDRFDVIERVDRETFTYYIECGKGVYVRTLIHDLGAKANIPAAAATLRRTRVGRIPLEKACQLKEIQSAGDVDQRILDAEEFLETYFTQ